MAETVVSDTLEVAISRNPHLGGEYLSRYRMERQRTPTFVPVPTSQLKELTVIDIIYPVGDPIFIHVHPENDASSTRRWSPQ